DYFGVELGIFSAPGFAGVFQEELALRNARRAEGVGLDDVGAGLEEPAVDIHRDVRPRQRKQVSVVEQVLFRSAEAWAADICLCETILAQGRTHTPVYDDDALAQEPLEGVNVGTQELRLAFLDVVPGLLALASTTCKCGFFASRQAISEEETKRPARVRSRR